MKPLDSYSVLGILGNICFATILLVLDNQTVPYNDYPVFRVYILFSRQFSAIAAGPQNLTVQSTDISV